MATDLRLSPQRSLRFTAERSDRGNSTKRRNHLAKIKRHPNDRWGLPNHARTELNFRKVNNESRTHSLNEI